MSDKELFEALQAIAMRIQWLELHGCFSLMPEGSKEKTPLALLNEAGEALKARLDGKRIVTPDEIRDGK